MEQEDDRKETTNVYDDHTLWAIQLACIKFMIRNKIIADVGEYVGNGHAGMFELFISGAARVATEDEIDSARTQVQQTLNNKQYERTNG